MIELFLLLLAVKFLTKRNHCFTTLYILLCISSPTTASLLSQIIGYLNPLTHLNDVHQFNNNNASSNITNSSLITFPLYGSPIQGFYLSVELGSPSQQFNILLDTGSSNLAIASVPHQYISTYFLPSDSKSFSTKHDKIVVPYSQGEWEGFIGSDILKIGNWNFRAEIALITFSNNFFMPNANWQGIWGMAYDDIAVFSDGALKQKSFWRQIVKEKGIRDIFTMVLHPSNPHITFGGVEDKDVEGFLHKVSLRKEWYYEVVLADIFINNTKVPLPCKELNFNKAIVDSGTTNLLFPPTVFEAVTDQLHSAFEEPGMSFWKKRQVWCTDESMLVYFPNVTISLFSSTSTKSNEVINLVLTPSSYLSRASQFNLFNSYGYSSSFGQICFNSAISSTKSGTVIGAVVMESFVVVFDRENKSLGFASYKGSSSVSSYVYRSTTNQDLTDCMYERMQIPWLMINTVYFSSFTVSLLVVLVTSVVIIKKEFFPSKNDIEGN